jgi:hypothetical protein
MASHLGEDHTSNAMNAPRSSFVETPSRRLEPLPQRKLCVDRARSASIGFESTVRFHGSTSPRHLTDRDMSWTFLTDDGASFPPAGWLGAIRHR